MALARLRGSGIGGVVSFEGWSIEQDPGWYDF